MRKQMYKKTMYYRGRSKVTVLEEIKRNDKLVSLVVEDKYGNQFIVPLNLLKYTRRISKATEELINSWKICAKCLRETELVVYLVSILGTRKGLCKQCGTRWLDSDEEWDGGYR